MSGNPFFDMLYFIATVFGTGLAIILVASILDTLRDIRRELWRIATALEVRDGEQQQ